MIKFSNKIDWILRVKTTILFNKINITTYFINLTVELHIFYAPNTHVKFCVNWILFTIWSISLYFIHNLNYKNLKFKQGWSLATKLVVP